MLNTMKRAFVAWLCSFSALMADGVVVVSGVTFEPGLPRNGGVATAFTSNLSVAGIVPANQSPLPLSLAGVTVEVCGVPAPIYAVADVGGYQQVNFQVPWESEFSDDSTNQRCLVRIRQGTFEVSVNAYVRRDAGPDLFFTPDFVGVFQHATDYARVTRSAPVVPGEAVILYGTTLPRTVPPVPTGVAAPLSPLAEVLQYVMTASSQTVRVDIGSEPVKPLWVGLVPGQTGLYQINFVVPEPTAAGDQILKVVVGRCTAFFGSGCAYALPFFTSYTYSNPVILPVGRL